MTTDKPVRGTQNIYSRSGDVLYNGGWDSRQLFQAVTGAEKDSYWKGRRVLDIGANTSGLSVEIARRGADVLAIEPDPYQNTKTPEVMAVLSQVILRRGSKARTDGSGVV